MRLIEKYKKEVIPKMMEKFKYQNPYQVPKIEKVVLNVGFGRLVAGKSKDEQQKVIQAILNDLALISGQRPILTLAKKSISQFKISKNQPIGAKVTLRRKRMFDFLERLIHIALPRSKDFKGISKSSFDKNGNLNIGIREHIAFPEISIENVKEIFGIEITIVTNAKNREEAIELFSLLGFPLKA